MSKERELLERWLDDTIFEPEELDSLMEETKELLAQPEQELVAWGYKKRVTYKPEGSEEEEIIPLYTAPPKREPLSDLRIRAANRNEYFEWGVRFAEKMHGITGVDDDR